MHRKPVIVLVFVIIAATLLSACQSVTPQQQAVVATYEALPAAQRTVVAEKAATALKSLSADQKSARRL